MDIDEQLIREIVRRICDVAKPDRIILFGSAAAGQMTPDSDIDLLVLKTDPHNAREERLRIRHALAGLNRSFDLIVMPTQRFEESKDVVGGLAYPAHRQGQEIYYAT